MKQQHTSDSFRAALQERVEAAKAYTPRGTWALEWLRDRIVRLHEEHVAQFETQIKRLADTILALDLRGTEDEGACGVAAIRLQELKLAVETLTHERDEAHAEVEDLKRNGHIYLAEACRKLEQEIAQLRALQVQDPCPACSGTGQKLYSNTSTWRHGGGGQMLTTDVCDTCWGSRTTQRTGADLRKLEAEMDRLRAELRGYTEANQGLLTTIDSLATSRAELSQENERLRAEVERLKGESAERLEDFRSGLAAGFGVLTADNDGKLTHEILVDLGQKAREHHEEHHVREESLEAQLTAAKEALRLADHLSDEVAMLDAFDTEVRTAIGNTNLNVLFIKRLKYKEAREALTPHPTPETQQGGGSCCGWQVCPFHPGESKTEER